MLAAIACAGALVAAPAVRAKGFTYRVVKAGSGYTWKISVTLQRVVHRKRRA